MRDGVPKLRDFPKESSRSKERGERIHKSHGSYTINAETSGLLVARGLTMLSSR
jgi:hypothetical protein